MASCLRPTGAGTASEVSDDQHVATPGLGLYRMINSFQ